MVSRAILERLHAGPLEPHFWRRLWDVKGGRRLVEKGCMNFLCTFSFSITFMKTSGLTLMDNLRSGSWEAVDDPQSTPVRVLPVGRSSLTARQFRDQELYSHR